MVAILFRPKCVKSHVLFADLCMKSIACCSLQCCVSTFRRRVESISHRRKCPYCCKVSVWRKLHLKKNKANLRDLIAATGLVHVILLKLDSSCRFFSLSGIWNLVDDLVKRYTSILRQALCIISNPLVNSNWSFTVWKHSIQVKIGNFLSRHSHVTLKFDGCPWKTIGHLFYTMSSFVHFFKAMDEFKRVIVRKRTILLIFLSGVTLKFDGWLWKTIGHLFCTTLSFVHHFKAIGEFKQVAVWKCSIAQMLKSAIFLSRVTSKFDGWPWKTIGHLFYAASSSKLAIFFAVWPWNLNGWPWKTIGHLS